MESNSASDSCDDCGPDVQFYQGFCDSSRETHRPSDGSKTYSNEFLNSIRQSMVSRRVSLYDQSCSCKRCLLF
ncbi:hypothetical protein SteCoe_32356 [Stentor coeruleus]|uniref:Uncharacterized protein n=1 Tax=Stentor coeruleus TaxID=5963 RepID=A0A1R2AZ77_9CILI|nr:hypothetical protein SteCoe_32356 [Stentor coeruleus]